MANVPSRAIWLIVLGVVILALAGTGATLWVRAAPMEDLRFTALSVIWLSFALQVMLVVGAVLVTLQFLQADRKRRAEEARVRHLADVALLSGGLAHEVRNHLHALQSRVGLLRKSLVGNEAALQRVDKLDEIADGLEQLLTNFLMLARPAGDQLEQVDPAEIIRDVVDFEMLDLERVGINVELDLEDGLRLLVDRGKLKRALLNVVVNARQAMPSGGRLRIRCRGERDGIQIAVEDEGEGIPPESLPRIFESYFTTKLEGSGLGLAIVRRTVEDFGGRVICTSAVGKGTTITIHLPAAGQRRSSRHESDGRLVFSGGSRS